MTILGPLAACLLLATPADDTKQKDLERLREENLKLREESLKLREALQASQQKLLEIAKQTEEVKKQVEQARREAVAAKVTEQAMRQRAAQMEQQLRELSREIALLKAGGKPDAPKRNAPPGNLSGKVSGVEKASGLIRLSVGADAGLEKGHQLEVYRLGEKPEDAKYLGRVEVLQTGPREAVARAVGRLASPVQVGDRVAARLDK